MLRMLRPKGTFVTPYYFCWLSTIALLLLGLIFKNNSADVQIYDTYIVISRMHVAAITVLVLSIFGGVYWLMDKYMRALLVFSYMHIFLTVLAFSLLICPLFDFIQSPEIFAFLVYGFFLTQVIFLANLITGYARR